MTSGRSARPWISAERDVFLDTLAGMQEQDTAVQGRPMDCNLTERQQRTMDRKLISRALVELGYLYYTRRRIARPIPRQKAA